MARNLKTSVSIMNKTKVAIPVFGLQVSPRCDCAQEMLFLEFDSGEIISRRTASMEGMNSLQRVRTISAAGVTTLICGAVPGFFRRMVEALGIRIMQTEGMEIDALIKRLKGGEFNLLVSNTHRGRGKRRRYGCPWIVNSV
jgi:predicted Fe-Mo cluster-binding NifX family protein